MIGPIPSYSTLTLALVRGRHLLRQVVLVFSLPHWMDRASCSCFMCAVRLCFHSENCSKAHDPGSTVPEAAVLRRCGCTSLGPALNSRTEITIL